MTPTDTSELALEKLIVAELTSGASAGARTISGVAESTIPLSGGYVEGSPDDYDRPHAVDIVKLSEFIESTQPEVYASIDLAGDNPSRIQFLNRLQGEIAKKGVVEVLRNGINHHSLKIDLFYGTPSEANAKAKEQFDANIFSVTRQLRYSNDETQRALDLAIFINGLPIATFELKNNLTKQTVADAVQQYKNDRNPRELLFQFGRCLVHFALDDKEVEFCTHLQGRNSWFLPFNMGYNDGAGNPPNPSGIMTAYLWGEVLTRTGLTNIIENYAQIVETKDEKTGKKKKQQIFPRYHQLDAVKALLFNALTMGPGQRYLIQHSAGSGKSNSIAWLAHQLVGLEKNEEDVFDSVIVVTDRVILDKQIRDTIKQFAQVSSIVGAVTGGSSQLGEFIEGGKKIIITTVQKFPFVLDKIGDDHRDRNFAILIDEAHSSQSGSAAAKMNQALSSNGSDEEETTEDKINQLMESKKMLSNASYFAFTATPKNKTLEVFGSPVAKDGVVKHIPFHTYSMKQAIQEGFILDVLANYTPVDSYYRLAKSVEDDPEFDTKKAQKKLRHYVETNSHAIRQKAEIMVDHFHEQVVAKHKIAGEARAMVVTGSIQRAIDYYYQISSYLTERNSPHKAIVAFSGEQDYKGSKVTEASINGFPSNKIPEEIQKSPNRILVCADKFQTGYDEPLLHTMYVDKPLSGIKAVQTLSRLNRAHPKKTDTFVLDFHNDTDSIKASFDEFYRTTILSGETDPNKLHDLKHDLDGHQIYSDSDIDAFVARFINGEPRDRLDPILDACTARYISDLDEDAQVDFKGKAKAFTRSYGFLASILPFSNAEWEKLSIFLNFLIMKLPAPVEEDLSKGILEAIDMDSYRVEIQEVRKIELADENSEIEPVPTAATGGISEPELDRLSAILQSFNDQYGGIEWKDSDKIEKVITEEIPKKLAADVLYQNAMKNSDRQNARYEHDQALSRVLVELLTDHTELFKQWSDNESFKKWLSDNMFNITYRPPAA